MMLLIFEIENRQCALNISIVEKTYRAAAITPLPKAPDIVIGIIDVRGAVLPVVSIRKRFMLPEKKLTPSDRFIIARTSGRQLVLVVDRIVGAMECDEQDITASDTILPGLDPVKGVIRSRSGMILIHDLDRFLSLAEASQLDQALADGE